MRKTITRKLTESTIHGYSVKVSEEGEASVEKLEPVTVYGNVSKAEAVKVLRKANKESDNVTVSMIQTQDVQFEIDVDVFIKHATRIEPTNENKEDNN